MMRRDSHRIVEMDKHADLAVRGQLAVPGMNDAQRLELLTQPSGQIPQRRVTTSIKEDPFGLLAHEDTYGALAGVIFNECEGIYHQLARFNPDVSKQYAQASKKPQKGRTITLPTTTLSGIYTFGMARTSVGTIVEYSFTRRDEFGEHAGFSVLHNASGNFVLKRLDGTGEKPTDAEYFGYIKSAQKWVEDYASQLNIQPRGLLDFAETAPIPRTARNIATQKLLHAFTVEKSGRRKPHMLAVLAAAALIPVSPTEVSSEALVLGGWHVIDHMATASDRAAAAHRAAQAKAAQAAVTQFDGFHLQLPSDASRYAVGEAGAVAYVADLNPAVENAPDYPSSVHIGSVRHLQGLDRVYQDGFDGLAARACANAVSLKLGESTVSIITTSPGSKGRLSVAVSNTQLEICNTSSQDLMSADLDGIYIEANR